MCGPASGWAKAALVVLLVGMSLHIAGWATTNWMTYSTSNNVYNIDVGLWRQVECNSGNCADTSVDSQYESDEFNAVRAFETITFCLVVFTIILLFIYLCCEMGTRSTFAMVIMFLCYLAGTCSFIGMIIFITSAPEDFEVSWSLGLTVIAMTLILIAGTLMIPDAFESEYENDDRDEDDDYFGTRRRGAVSPMSLQKIGPSSRGITPPISYRGAIEGGSRWRSY